MNVCTPYTRINESIKQALRDIPIEYVEMKTDSSYPELLDQKFQNGERFIIVEHDVLPHTGALEEIYRCPAEWCAFGYDQFDNFADPSTCVYFGCVKFGEQLIKKLKDVWQKMPRKVWSSVDCYFTPLAREHFSIHQHFPSVKHIKL